VTIGATGVVSAKEGSSVRSEKAAAELRAASPRRGTLG
jgi:hypothetical protein